LFRGHSGTSSTSDADVFADALKGIDDYLKSKNVAVAYEIPGTLSHSEFTTSTDKIIAAAKYAHAESVLHIEVDRPITKWIKVQCLDSTGKELWPVKAGSGGGFTVGHGLRVGLEHRHNELDKRAGWLDSKVFRCWNKLLCKASS
jgi:hypothetical protein